MEPRKKVTTRYLKRLKAEKEPIAMITAYDYPSAQLADQAGTDIILVGDSLGMVVLGYSSTIPVTIEDMLHHTKAVTRGVKYAMVITDLPFMTAHLSVETVLAAAARLMQEAGAYGIKVEGGGDLIPKIDKLTKAGVPVMGHLGLTPQSVNQLGGYIVQGKDVVTAKTIMDEAKCIEDAGAFSLVLECVPEELAQQVSDSLAIPVFGIGAGRYCDGQVLVYHDLLGMTAIVPSFVKTYANVGDEILSGISEYVREVKEGKFPQEGHVTRSAPQVSLYGK